MCAVQYRWYRLLNLKGSDITSNQRVELTVTPIAKLLDRKISKFFAQLQRFFTRKI